jgi:hypothetical protein
MLGTTTSYDHHAFNRLSTIEEANAALQLTEKLQIAFAVLGPRFIKHNMHDHWGICLLHKHWPLRDGEAPIHVQTTTPAGREWSCEPRTGPFTASSWPSVLRFDADAVLQPLEFSTERHLEAAGDLLDNARAFQKQIGAAMREHGLEDTFGLVAIREPRSDCRLIEFTHDRTSVVREVPAAGFANPVIQTNWRFKPNTVMGGCVVSCFTDCNDEPDGSHSTKHVHTHNK